MQQLRIAAVTAWRIAVLVALCWLAWEVHHLRTTMPSGGIGYTAEQELHSILYNTEKSLEQLRSIEHNTRR